jgi:large subunit ribosomal protein L21
MSSESTSYAVVKTSGRQYRVSAGDSFSVEKIGGAPGTKLEIKEVLMLGGAQTLLGTPYVAGATVTCVVEQQYRGTKVLVFKKKRRNNYKKMQGHRSELTRLFVSEITTPSGVIKAEGKPHVLDADHAKKVTEQKAVKAAAPKGESRAQGGTGHKALAPKKKTAKKAGVAKSKSKPKTKTKKS